MFFANLWKHPILVNSFSLWPIQIRRRDDDGVNTTELTIKSPFSFTT